MIYLTSDWHGSINGLSNFVNSIDTRTSLTKNDIVVILGDAGIMYGNYVMGDLRRAMAKYPCTFFIMRGNHDKRYGKYAQQHPERWKTINFGENEAYVDYKYPNIIYARDDAAIYIIDDIKFLLIPGAYSVDKNYRIMNNMPWEKDEQLTKEELAAAVNLAWNNDINIILSHTGPLQFQEKMKDLLLDYVINPDNQMEETMDLIYDTIGQNIDWYWGHFHGTRDFNDNAHLIYQQAVCINKEKYNG